MPSQTLYLGPIVHSLSLKHLEVIDSALLCVSSDGVIEWLEKDVERSQLQDIASRHGLSMDGNGITGVEVIELGPGEVLCPGMVDTHTHAPQFPNIGLGGGVQLLDWLDQLTFPEEKKYSDVEYAKEVYGEVVERTLNAGTTTCCYYASTHLESTAALAEICLDKGQRAFVGKCCMDRQCPDDYVETTESSLADTRSFLSTFPHLSSSTPAVAGSSALPLVQPILTPRFAISCTPQLLRSLGDLASSFEPSLAIQTHLSENHAEIQQAHELFPDSKTYAGVYEESGLLGPGSILAHCVHLDDEDREVIRRTGAGVSHCPTSNLHLNSGLARVRELLDIGIKVGLGTDCSGGYATSILSAIRNASIISKCLSFTSQPTSATALLEVSELWYLATLGGGSLCRLDQHIGNFIPGKQFDAIRIKAKSPGMWVREGETARNVFERWIWCGDDRDILDVWVKGRRVGGAG